MPNTLSTNSDHLTLINQHFATNVTVLGFGFIMVGCLGFSAQQLKDNDIPLQLDADAYQDIQQALKLENFTSRHLSERYQDSTVIKLDEHGFLLEEQMGTCQRFSLTDKQMYAYDVDALLICEFMQTLVAHKHWQSCNKRNPLLVNLVVFTTKYLSEHGDDADLASFTQKTLAVVTDDKIVELSL